MRRILLALLLSSLFSVSLASNWGFLKDAPIVSFNSKDTTLMEKTIFKALDTIKDGDKLAWKNDKTGNSGLANPINSYKVNGKSCRTIRIINRSKKNIAESQHNFCQAEDKSWKLYIKTKSK